VSVDVFLNWLFQGGIVAMAAAAVLRVMEPLRARARYWTVWVALLAVVALPAVPFVWALVLSAPVAARPAAPTESLLSTPDSWWTSTAVAMNVWALWASVSAGRILLAALSMRRARRECRDFPAGREVRLLQWARIRATGRRTHLVLCDSVRSAAILGCGSPVIAVAPALLEQLCDADIDRIVIHEWAHVQGRDDLGNLVVLAIRVMAGWHPAVWWLDRRLRVEREMACDEMVVAVTGSARDYAACLVTLASLPLTPRSSPVLAAASATGLRRRITAVVSQQQRASASWWPATVFGAGVLLATLSLIVGTLRIVHGRVPTENVDITLYSERAEMIGTKPSMPPHIATEALYSGGPVGSHVQRPLRISRRVRHGHQSPTTAEQQPYAGLSTQALLADQQVATMTSRRADILAAPHVLAKSVVETPPQASVWDGAADAGMALGGNSKRAAVATSRWVTRFARKIAGSF